MAVDIAVARARRNRAGWVFHFSKSEQVVPKNLSFKNEFLKSVSICRFSSGLFESHKLLFSFNMTIKIEQAEGRVPQEELEFFLKGNEFALFHSSRLPGPTSTRIRVRSLKQTAAEILLELGFQQHFFLLNVSMDNSGLRNSFGLTQSNRSRPKAALSGGWKPR